jgi:hypothetical protein
MKFPAICPICAHPLIITVNTIHLTTECCCLNQDCTEAKVECNWFFYLEFRDETVIQYGIPLILDNRIYVLNSSMNDENWFKDDDREEHIPGPRTFIQYNEALSIYDDPIVVKEFFPFVSPKESLNLLNKLLKSTILN